MLKISAVENPWSHLDEVGLCWLIECHGQYDPFEVRRAAQISVLLEKYGRTLKEQLGLEKILVSPSNNVVYFTFNVLNKSQCLVQ